MKKYLNGNLLFTLMLAIVFLILFITDLGYNYQARMVPLIVVIPSFLLAAAQLIIEIRAARAGKETAKGKMIPAKDSVLAAIGAADAPMQPPGAPAAVSESILAVAAAELADSPTVTRTATGKMIPNLESNLIVAEAVKQERDDEESQLTPAAWKGQFIAIGWLIGLVLLIALFGFNVGLPVFVFAFLKWHGRESWKFSILYTLVFWVLVYLLFGVLMKSILYPGMVFDRLGF